MLLYGLERTVPVVHASDRRCGKVAAIRPAKGADRLQEAERAVEEIERRLVRGLSLGDERQLL